MEENGKSRRCTRPSACCLGAPCSELHSHLDLAPHGPEGMPGSPARPPAVPCPCGVGRVGAGADVELTDAG